MEENVFSHVPPKDTNLIALGFYPVTLFNFRLSLYTFYVQVQSYLGSGLQCVNHHLSYDSMYESHYGHHSTHSK